MDKFYTPHSFETCPLCRERLTYFFHEAYCEKCHSLFKYNSTDKFWEHPRIMDVSYLNPEGNVLSNLFPYSFTMTTKTHGTLKFSCMESFLNVITWRGSFTTIYNEIGSLSGMDAMNVKKVLPDWRRTQTVYWDENAIKRDSPEYMELIQSAYDSLFEQSHLYKVALRASADKVLVCTSYSTNPEETLLTSHEFLYFLNDMRNRLFSECDFKDGSILDE